jgi:hypothetical protein
VIEMALFSRKSQLQQLLDTVDDWLDVPNGVKSGLPGRAAKGGLIAAGGLAALTAASAGISALRQRADGQKEGS